MSTVKGTYYLVAKAKLMGRYSGWELKAVRVTLKKPTVGKNEVAIAIHLEIPVSFFETPLLQATIKLEGSPSIDAETIGNLEDVIRSEGFDVSLIQVEVEDSD